MDEKDLQNYIFQKIFSIRLEFISGLLYFMRLVIVLPHPCIHKYSMFEMPVEPNIRPMLNTT